MARVGEENKAMFGYGKLKDRVVQLVLVFPTNRKKKEGGREGGGETLPVKGQYE
jgi:hypothetical protein